MSVSVPARLSADQVWRAVARVSFAVLTHVTPAGAPRSSGVVHTVVGDRMVVVVGRDSWKARHIAADGRVSVTVPIRRGGPLALLFPIPPATVSFAATATVRPATSLAGLPQLERMVPAERREDCAVLEIRPTGTYVTYGLGVPLLRLRDPAVARGRVQV